MRKTLALGPITFRHEPTGRTGEIAGHLHPSARIYWRGRSVVRRCFAADSKCVVMPAFGAYTGGLSIRDRAFAAIFRAREFTAHVLGDRRVYVFSSAHCLVALSRAGTRPTRTSQSSAQTSRSRARRTGRATSPT